MTGAANRRLLRELGTKRIPPQELARIAVPTSARTTADENVSSLHLKRVIGQLSSSSEVAEQLLEATVGPGDAIVAGYGPHDVRSEELLKASAGAARVELVLRLVQSVEKVDGSVPVHGRCRRRSEQLVGVRRRRLASARPPFPLPSRSIAGYTIRCRNGLIAAM